MERPARTVVSFVWAAVPFASVGLATAPAFIYPAVRRRKAGDLVALIAYLALAILAFLAADTSEGSVGDYLFGLGLLVLWLGGTAHAFIIRSRVFALRDPNERVIAMADQRRELREAARATAGDPALAWELRIGRPDLARGFDDGGLVDVNHAPPHVLGSLPGMTPALVDQVVRAREQAGGFTSVEELSVLAQLPPALTESIGEYAVFLP